MAKISRPIVYALVLGAVGAAVYFLTEPDQAARKGAKRTTTTASSAPAGFTEEDMKAQFPRYTGPQRNAFLPKVLAKKGGAAGAAGGPGAGQPSIADSWELTGINVINGVRKAVLENPSTTESVFLAVGERWQGMTVAGIEPTAIVFVRSTGERLRLGFTQPGEEKPMRVTGTAPVLLPTPQPGTAPASVPATTTR